MESAWRSTFLLGLFLVPCSLAQGTVHRGDTGTVAGSKSLQPWLVGLTAVMCFLFVIFVATLINRFFCSKMKSAEETPKRDAELRAEHNVYDNIVMEMEEGTSKTAAPEMEDDKRTNL
ncbi:small integral membrane protein 24 [Heteronotia binoei]|uniref:small integral membrane protein 24 n=1 Tax=Heteronotia binoei TaxID=13085 RepID=UPI00292ECC8B|nr:small integral membrane protein 24 [Heteronotia binoei]